MSQQINLFNPIFLKQEKHFSAMAMLQVLGLILLCAVLLVMYSSYQLSQLQKEHAVMTVHLQQTQNQLAKVTAEYGPRKKDPVLAEKVRQEELVVRSLRQVSDILQKGEFGNTNGYGDYLSAFARQIMDGIWLTGFTIRGAGSEISIRGSALRPESVPAYLSKLKTEPVMQGASFATLEMELPKASGLTPNAGKPQAPFGYINFDLHSSVNVKIPGGTVAP